MQLRFVALAGALSCALAGTACSTDRTADDRTMTSTAATDTAREADRIADAQRDRENDIAKMDERVTRLQRDYDEKSAARPRGTSGSNATARLQDDVRDDMNGVKKAVDDLRTTTAENWWDRHERAMKEAADEIDRDVRRFATGRSAAAAPRDRRDMKDNVKDMVREDRNGQPVSNAPFASARDRFVTDMQARVDGWNRSLDNVKANGARKTELDDLKARINKIDDDIDHLKTAEADDWWDLSKARVNDYIERVEKSIARLDDNVKR